MTWEVPLVRVEDRVALPGVTLQLAVHAKSRPALERALASETRHVVTVLAFQDGIAPIGTVSVVEELTAERVRLRPESRVRIHFVRGDLAAVEAYADVVRETTTEEEDRVRSLLLARVTQGLRLPGDVIEQVALTKDPERLAYLVLAYCGAPPGRLQRALELVDAAARLSLCR